MRPMLHWSERSAFKASVCVFILALASVRGGDPANKDSKGEGLTLPEAIVEARTHNPQMLALEAAGASARGGVLTAKTFGSKFPSTHFPM